jgi:type IV fimbrial biogenesis protein FimT
MPFSNLPKTPSFRSMMANNRAATQANQLVSAINHARSEAVARADIVTLCPKSTVSETSTTCGTNAHWANGWFTFVDDSGVAGTFDGTDVALKHWVALDGSPTVTSTAANIRFSADGAKTDTTNIGLTMQQANTTGDQDRCVRISGAGQTRLYIITGSVTCP